MRTVKAIIEIPKLATAKYELKGKTLILDRMLSLPYPQNYGYIPNTLAEDGDPLDIFVIAKNRNYHTSEALYPGTHCEVEIVAGFECYDHGQSDAKLIGVVTNTNLDAGFIQSEIRYILKFLEEYKGDKFVVRDQYTPPEIANLLKSSKKAFRDEK